jgi:hypothetical protein
MSLDEMLTLAENQARTVMIGTKVELTPVWLMVTWDGKIEIFATPWGSDLEKRLAIEAMRLTMREKQVQAYSMLTEAWMARATPDEVKQQEYSGLPPSQRADRQEAVVIMAANRDGETRYRTLETVRARNGKCAELRQLSTEEHQFTGIFDNLLDDKRRAN